MTDPNLIDQLTELRDRAREEASHLDDALRAYKGHKRPGRPIRARVGEPEPAGAPRRGKAGAAR